MFVSKKELVTNINILEGKIRNQEVALNVLRNEISDKQIELLTKIVCHLSGAKTYDGKKDFPFDEISRRLAKLEGREDMNNG